MLRGTSCLVSAISCAAFVQAAAAAPAVTQPPMDLGQTSFLDGEAGPGGLFEVIGDGTTARYFTDGSGRGLQGQHKLWSGSLILHPAYVSDLPALGGKLGLEFLFPFATVHSTIAGQSATTEGAAGDMTVAPFIEWSGGRLFDQPVSVRLAIQLTAPTGSYSPSRSINAGQNAWQVSPYLAFTWRATDRWEVSGRTTYDWSGRNNNPGPAFDTRSIQAGDQLEMNLSASYAVTETGRIGLAGYALQQLGDAEIGGAAVPGSRQRAFGLGPGVLWDFGGTTLVGTAYREFETENRPEGFQFVLRLLQPF